MRPYDIRKGLHRGSSLPPTANLSNLSADSNRNEEITDIVENLRFPLRMYTAGFSKHSKLKSTSSIHKFHRDDAVSINENMEMSSSSCSSSAITSSTSSTLQNENYINDDTQIKELTLKGGSDSTECIELDQRKSADQINGAHIDNEMLHNSNVCISKDEIFDDSCVIWYIFLMYIRF